MRKLTAGKIKGIKATGKRQSFYDGDYLYLFVSATGKKSFFLKGYRFNGKPIKQIKLGEYIDGKKGMTLSQARAVASTALAEYKNGVDYGDKVRKDKQQARLDQINTVKQWSGYWIETKKDKSEKTLSDYQGKLNKWILPKIGGYSINHLTLQDIKELYRYIESNGSAELVKRCHSILNDIYSLAINEGVTDTNPTFGARYGMIAPKKEHLPALTAPKDIGRLLRDMENYQGMPSTIFAYRLIPYLMLRPGELVSLKWENIDLDNALIRMKTTKRDRYHLVPMARQVVALFTLIHEYSGHCEYVLPNRSGKGHMARDTLSKGLRTIGYSGKHTPHGFRSTASTNLYENEHYDYAIEKQLAHKERDEVKASYNRDNEARYLQARREMMQELADLIDRCKNNDGDSNELNQQLQDIQQRLSSKG